MADGASSLIFFVSGVIGFAPAVAVLYHALRTYDYPYTEKSYFDSRRVFFGLAVGMVIGTISGVVSFSVGATVGSLVALVVLLILTAVFEEGFKLIYLNRKGYRGRFDTTFVGVGLATGIAAISTAGPAYANGPALLSPSVFLPFAAYSVSLAFVHESTGAILGLGCSKGEVVVPFFTLYSAPAALAIPAVAGLAAAIAFTALLYGYVYRSVIPATLPSELRRERRRTVRKRARA